jgi:hypothetical protein
MFEETEDGNCLPNGDSNDILDESKSPVPADVSRHDMRKNAGQPPSLPRPNHGLCGLFNRGATCYLNSLLQVRSVVFMFGREVHPWRYRLSRYNAVWAV